MEDTTTMEETTGKTEREPLQSAEAASGYSEESQVIVPPIDHWHLTNESADNHPIKEEKVESTEQEKETSLVTDVVTDQNEEIIAAPEDLVDSKESPPAELIGLTSNQSKANQVESIPLPRHKKTTKYNATLATTTQITRDTAADIRTKRREKQIENNAANRNVTTTQITRDIAANIRRKRREKQTENRAVNQDTIQQEPIEENVGAFPLETPAPFSEAQQQIIPRPPQVESNMHTDSNMGILAEATLVDNDEENNNVAVASVVEEDARALKREQEALHNRSLMKLSFILSCFLVLGVLAGVLISQLDRSESPTTNSPTPLTQTTLTPITSAPAPTPITSAPTPTPITAAPTSTPIIEIFGTIYSLEATSIHNPNGSQQTGTIPSALGLLTALTYLYLSDSQLTGPLPSEVGLLTSLTYLRLSSNQLTGTFPSELGLLTDVTDLWLYENKLSGQLPTEIGQMTALVEVSLRENQLTGRIPTELGQMTDLGRFSLAYNKLTGNIPSTLGLLTALTDLGWASNNLVGPIPTEVGRLTSVTSLWLFENELGGQIPTEMGQMTELMRLSFRENQLSGPIPTELSQLTSLICLTSSSNNLTGPFPIALGQLPACDLG